MEDTQIKARTNEDIYFSFVGQASYKDIKLKLGLAELIFQALILLLLV